MPRRIASVCLLCAWLCASSAVLDVAQVFAWARMFGGYARTESVLEAARDTFDPGRPCALCRAVSRAREEAGRQAAVPRQSGTEKLILVIERPPVFLAARDREGWPAPSAAASSSRSAEVPVPPPRACA